MHAFKHDALITMRHVFLLITREVSAMFRVEGATLFKLSAQEEHVCYEKLKQYFDQMYFAN